MTLLSARIRDLALTMTTAQAQRYHDLKTRVGSVYDAHKVTERQQLYIVERILTDTPIDFCEVLRLNPTAAAKKYLDPPKPKLRIVP